MVSSPRLLRPPAEVKGQPTPRSSELKTIPHQKKKALKTKSLPKLHCKEVVLITGLICWLITKCPVVLKSSFQCLEERRLHRVPSLLTRVPQVSVQSAGCPACDETRPRVSSPVPPVPPSPSSSVWSLHLPRIYLLMMMMMMSLPQRASKSF